MAEEGALGLWYYAYVFPGGAEVSLGDFVEGLEGGGVQFVSRIRSTRTNESEMRWRDIPGSLSVNREHNPHMVVGLPRWGLDPLGAEGLAELKSLVGKCAGMAGAAYVVYCAEGVGDLEHGFLTIGEHRVFDVAARSDTGEPRVATSAIDEIWINPSRGGREPVGVTLDPVGKRGAQFYSFRPKGGAGGK